MTEPSDQPYVWVPPTAPPTSTRRRVIIAAVAGVAVAAAAVVAEWVAAVLLTPTCSYGPATPGLVGACIGLTAVAAAVPAAIVGIRAQPAIAGLLAALAALAPGGVLVHMATTQQSGFCF